MVEQWYKGSSVTVLLSMMEEITKANDGRKMDIARSLHTRELSATKISCASYFPFLHPLCLQDNSGDDDGKGERYN